MRPQTATPATKKYRMSLLMLSILLLTYNDVKYLEGCLDSIQKYVAQPFEVILIDNGSSEQIPDSLRERSHGSK